MHNTTTITSANKNLLPRRSDPYYIHKIRNCAQPRLTEQKRRAPAWLLSNRPPIWIRALLVNLTVPRPAKKFAAFCGSPKPTNRVYNSLTLEPILSQMNPVHILPIMFTIPYFSIILSYQASSSKRSPSFRCLHQNPIRTSFLPHAWHVPSPS